jgi:hypothetical protein
MAGRVGPASSRFWHRVKKPLSRIAIRSFRSDRLSRGIVSQDSAGPVNDSRTQIGSLCLIRAVPTPQIEGGPDAEDAYDAAGDFFRRVA